MTPRSATRPEPILDQATRGLLGAITADPVAPLRVGIVAPGGYGKTTVLAEVEQVYRRAGVPIVSLDQACGGTVAANSAVLLVDDAHQLDDNQLRELRRLVETTWSRVVVGYRPWPRSTALIELAEVLARGSRSLALSPFRPEQIGAYIATALDTRPRIAVAEFLHAQTGGVPKFVERVVATLTPSDVTAPKADLEIPASAIAQFRYDFDRLDPDVLKFLLAAEVGVGLQIDLLGALLGRGPDSVTEVIEAARAAGLLGPDGATLPITLLAVRALNPVERRISVRHQLAALRLQRGGSVLDLARSLLGSGIVGGSVPAVFEAAADEALSEQPALSAQLYHAAVTAGRPMAAIAARWAQAAALSGDLGAALKLADQVISTDNAADRVTGAMVAATALTHRGQLGRGAQLYRWAGTSSSAAFAVIGLLGTGHLTEAEQLLAAPTADGPPTLLAGSASLMAQGVHESVTGSMTSALSTLIRAAALLEPTGQAALGPDSPAALAAIVALHCGELDIAESLLDRALAAAMGGPLMATRHHLLRAWISMVRGDTTSALRSLAAATKSGSALQPRDWLFAVGVEVGLARRNSDLAVLSRTWGQACEAIMRHPVDLYTFLPLGEFAVAAARLRDQGRLAPHLREARSLLEQLGTPPLWATPLHWSGLHAAIIAEDRDMAEDHAQALARGSNERDGRYGPVMAAAAARWLDVMAGKVDPIEVEAAARALHDVGLWWDGARLAKQAAIRTSGRKAMLGLLECARTLQGGRTSAKPAPAPAPAGAPVHTPTRPPADDLRVGRLSDREMEVAALVVAGLTYKQIGDRLFISAKTVEHHVARMRQRLGSNSRGELLAALRQLTAERS